MIRLILILIALPTLLLGQKVPDNDAILRNTIDNQSPHYYPAIFTRYLAGDTTLTADDYHHLYYGFAYRDEYRPLEASPASYDKIMMIFEQNAEPDAEQSEQIIKLASEVMKVDPFNPKIINFLIYAYGTVGDSVGEKINYNRLNKIIETIKLSGSGIKEDSPWHVLAFSHSNDVLATMEIQPIKRLVISQTVEYITILERKDKIKGYYFNFSRVYWRKPDTQRTKRVQGLEFNGIKPKPLKVQ